MAAAPTYYPDKDRSVLDKRVLSVPARIKHSQAQPSKAKPSRGTNEERSLSYSDVDLGRSFACTCTCAMPRTLPHNSIEFSPPVQMDADFHSMTSVSMPRSKKTKSRSSLRLDYSHQRTTHKRAQLDISLISSIDPWV
ncbi:hypothetical protein H2248_002238 [Termitomyces sp. 'cryptogamus']|nr:hypothetical protein H2248_002238 [Termitomyces sp. 'cryptogamus']